MLGRFYHLLYFVLVEASKVLAGLNHHGQNKRIPGGAKSGHIVGKREIHASLNFIGFVKRFIPGRGSVPLFAPWTLCDRLDDHRADIFGSAGGDKLFGVFSVFWIRHLDEIQGEHHGVEIESPERLEIDLRRLGAMTGDSDKFR